MHPKNTLPSKNTFLYDGECDFCIKSANWLEAKTDQSLKLAELENPSRQQAALFIDKDGRTHSGHKAIAAALSLSPKLWVRSFAGVVKFSGPVGALVYRAVANRRN